MSAGQTQSTTMTQNQYRFADFMTDVLVYIVVLNLFVEYNDAIIIDSFSISILTAVVLKLLLDALTGVEQRVHHLFQEREGTIYQVLGGLSRFAILFLGTLLILEVDNFVFGDHVELGRFIDVVGLIIAMIVARLVVQKTYQALGDGEPPDGQPPTAA